MPEGEDEMLMSFADSSEAESGSFEGRNLMEASTLTNPAAVAMAAKVAWRLGSTGRITAVSSRNLVKVKISSGAMLLREAFQRALQLQQQHAGHGESSGDPELFPIYQRGCHVGGQRRHL